MSRRAAVTVGLAIGTAVLAAGCSTGSPAPIAAWAGVPTTTTLGISPAPKVQHPLDPARMIAAPCTTLTPRQASVFDAMPAGQRVYDPEGPSCEWRSVHDVIVRVTWLTTHHPTLASMYEHWSDYSTWSPFTVPDEDQPQYPGVFASIGNHDADTYVAVNDDVLCRIHMDTPTRRHPSPPDSSAKFFVYGLVDNLEHG